MRCVHSIAGALVLLQSATGAVAQRNAVDDYIEGAMTRQHIPGLSLVVVRDGEVLKAKGYGLANVEHGVRVTPETVFELASATKPFVATAILMLAQDGKLRLDDPIARYVDSVPAAFNGVTIRHLLTHTSGIKDYLGELRRDFPYDTPAEVVAHAALDAGPGFRPGTRWSYSNSGFVLLGLIVKRAGGESYDSYLARHVFGPLGMSGTRHDVEDEIVPKRASGYLWSGAGGLRNGDYLRYAMTNHGDRGLLSTALDLARWDIALSRGRLLTSSAREEMWRASTLDDGARTGYGLGWFVDSVRGHRHIHHAGSAPGSATIIARYPDDQLTVIVLTNGGAAYPQALELGVAQHYIRDLRAHPVARLRARVLDGYAGYYNAYGSQLLTVKREQDFLTADDGGRLANRFLPTSESSFVAEDAERGFTMRRSATGELTGMMLRLVRDTMSVQRIGPLAPRREPNIDPDSLLTRRVERVLEAFEAGGRRVETVVGVAPEARNDFARGPSPEFAAMRGISFLAAHDVTSRGIVRHGGSVQRVLYYRLHFDGRARTVLVYLTAGDLVTDEDVID